MLRDIVPLLFLVAASVAVPAVYQSSPFAIQQFLEGPDPDFSSPGAAPAHMAAMTSAVPRAPVSPLGRKALVAADPRDHFVSEFRMNGRRVEAMIDTGATTVAINRSTARNLGISLTPDDFRYEIRTANGVTRAASVLIESIAIGRILIEDVQAAVLEDDALGNTLIGMTFLSRLQKFQIENNTLLLEE
ncbi:TIGR02281 family clan AA aspartic protease [Mesorhizobium sp. NBSH29]|uniref:retropepsin-like aspartic protease family protein n=1 Tax=Mesorhizobium sp. NBSH29 TaxID=2654249 RepID=UPI0018968879|nr:TIGR02281 family clan AA aspartic protease [Mesorhizobium sp. NBSH29]QPC86470.1 TIGR02281 family clan AA aspartic protease [Mesorhizobium sp. NBSH29]